ncbi:hypothetical protein EV426DRAFT_700163 [Tirmania nivea]|nr:hypothetical protein EV426DRAFT_700163 [Tirmania nivea]
MLERARRFVRGEERIKFGKGKETVKRKWEESGGLLDPEELFTDDDGGDGGGEKVVAEMRGALRIHDGGDGSVDENNPVLMRVKVDGKGELTRYNLTVTSVVPDLGSPGEGQKQLFISGDGVASTRPVGGGTPVIGNESAATVTRDQNTVRVPCSARSNSSDSKSSSQSRLGGKGMTILMQHRRRRRRERSNLANSHASVGVGTPMGGTKGLASLTRSSKGSVGSGYIAGDEDVGEPGCEALRLSSPIFTSLGFLEARNPSLAESKTGSRVPSWGTDGSGSGESVQSGESRRSVESVSSGYGGEWGWSRLGFKRRRSARSKASHVKSVRENVENEDQVEWEGMEPLPMDNDDGQFDDGEEISEIELIPEDVRGSWGRNGGYLGLGVLRAASEGKRSAKRRVLSELDVSAPEMGRSESRIDTPFERARSALKRNVSTSSCSLSSGPRNVRNPPWFMSLRSLRVPEGSSGSASASGSMDGVGETVISDKEMRKVERLREVGRRVREVGTERGERRLGMGDIEVEVLEGGVDREKEGGTRRRVVSEPRGVGARMGLTLREAERVFWDRSISREVEELWGPVGDGVAPRAGAVRMQVAGEWVELD